MGMLGYLIVFVGGGIGSALRYAVNRFAMAQNWQFPSHTLIINVVGCFLMGCVVSWFALRGDQNSQTVRLFLTTGILGGFTTFSAFSLDFALLWQRGETMNAALYVAGSVVLSLVGVFAGLAAVRYLFN